MGTRYVPVPSNWCVCNIVTVLASLCTKQISICPSVSVANCAVANPSLFRVEFVLFYEDRNVLMCLLAVYSKVPVLNL